MYPNMLDACTSLVVSYYSIKVPTHTSIANLVCEVTTELEGVEEEAEERRVFSVVEGEVGAMRAGVGDRR